MKLEHCSIYSWLKTTAQGADEFIVISPFFSMSDDITTLLESIPRLQILIGDEFATNNLAPLMGLSELDSTEVRCIYRQKLDRRLHAKVFYAIAKSGRIRALVGSANFTVNGLTKNIEQAISLDSDCVSDRETLIEIRQWIDELLSFASGIDWVKAKEEYERAPNPTFTYEDFCAHRQDQDQNCWVLKTTVGSTGPSRWEEFVKEQVLSIGWVDVVEIMADQRGIDPGEFEIESLVDAAATWADREQDAGNPNHAANMLYCFTREFTIGDRVILCSGYAPNQYADVYLYGLAIVDGNIFDDRASDWWRLKRRSVLWRKDVYIPKAVFVNALGNGSLLQTIHKISKNEYEEFCHQILSV